MPRTSRIARSALRALFYALYLAAFVTTAVYLFAYRGFVQELRETRWWVHDLTPPGDVRPETMRRVGSLLVDRESSFVRFSREAAPGVRRICSLGDSYTYGDETAPPHDIASLLGRELARAGVADVESLNFGSSWHGFHQTAILWEDEASRYGCDWVVLGPGSFQPERDVRFSHSSFAAPYYLHARYVIEGNDIRLVEVSGTTAEERFERYHSFFQPWRYLRYDRNPPIALQAVLGRSRTLPNPFYYRDDDETDEAFHTYAHLLARMGASGAAIVILSDRPQVRALADDLGDVGAAGLETLVPERFPYQAPRGHLSSLGNWLLARRLFALAVGAPDSNVPVLELESPPEAGTEITPRGSEQLGDVRLAIGAEAIGVLVRASPKFRLDGAWQRGDLAEARGLLLLDTEAPGLLDAAFVPLAEPLAPDASLEMRIPTERGLERFVLARVETPPFPVSIGIVTGFAFDQGTFRLTPRERVFREALSRAGDEVGLFLGERPLLKGHVVDGAIVIDDGYRRARVPEGIFVDVTALPSEGTIDLVFPHSQGEIRRPLARFVQRPGTFGAPPTRPPRALARPSTGVHAD